MTNSNSWQAAGLNRRKIGDYIVTAIVDGFIAVPFDLLAGIGPDEAMRMTVAAGRPSSSAMTVSTYLIEGKGRTYWSMAVAAASMAGEGDCTPRLPRPTSTRS